MTVRASLEPNVSLLVWPVGCRSSRLIRPHSLFKIGARVPEIREGLLILRGGLRHVRLLGLQVTQKSRLLFVLLENYLQLFLLCILRELSDVQTRARFSQFPKAIAHIENNLAGSFG